MNCAECGQRVGVTERHTFIDCAIWRAKLGGTLEPKYARALEAEIARLRAVVEAARRWAADETAYAETDLLAALDALNEKPS